MKRGYLFTALLFAVFMFPFFGSISNADALGNYGCGNPDKKTHVNCLRGLLSSTPHGLAVQQSSPSNDGLGNYGCGNRNKRTHVNCLRGLLDQHGAHLQVGNHGGGASGTHPPVDISHCATLPPDTRPQCEAAAHGGPPPGGQHNGPPPGGPGDHPDCPAGTTCGGPNDHHGDQQASHCEAMGMADGSPHVDPPQDLLDQVEAEYEANCQSGNCFLGEGNYKLLEDMGHTRAKVNCFLAAGERQHNEEHGGNHPPAGNP